METVAIIVAGGRGVRAGGGLPKQYRPLGGQPLLRHTIACFARHPSVDAVRVVIHPDDQDLYAESAAGFETGIAASAAGVSSLSASITRWIVPQSTKGRAASWISTLAGLSPLRLSRPLREESWRCVPPCTGGSKSNPAADSA